jgi:hypothetical protein
MKKLIMVMALLIPGLYEAVAQQIPKQIIVEHFTNTYCSVCAGRNPGFYNNLKNFPQVIHIAYHPSSPYAACPLNQHNKPENDARTRFYGVYGSTPRLVVQGIELSANEDYNSPLIFNNHLDETSSFEMRAVLEQIGASLKVTVIVKKVDTSSLSTLGLYSALVEDTLNFAAQNGETVHHDVFRKSFFDTIPVTTTAPIAIGDSVVYIETIAINNAWNLSQCYAVAMLSAQDKQVVQATRSIKLMETTGINELQENGAFKIYPNPARKRLMLKGNFTSKVEAEIFDMSGRSVYKKVLSSESDFIDLNRTAAGNYLLKLKTEKGTQVIKFNQE